MQLPDAVQKVLANAAKLKASNAANEANTKFLLIEPPPAALGWDPTNGLMYRVYKTNEPVPIEQKCCMRLTSASPKEQQRSTWRSHSN